MPNVQHEQQDRDRHGDVQLALLQVILEHRVEVVLGRRLPGEIGPGSGDLPDGGSHLLGAPLRIGGLEGGHDRRRDHVVPDHASTDEPARGQLRGRAASRSGDLLDPFGGRPSVFTTSVNEPTDR